MSKHAHIPGMVNPYKFGLLGGLSGFLQGYGANLDAQRKYAAMSQIEEMKARNNRLLKMLEMEGNQRAYTVHQVGDDGKVYDVAMRNTLNPQTGKWEPQEIGRAPSKDPLAATNALIASREKIAHDQIAAANSRNAARIAAKNDPSVETAAERRNKLQQDAENRRAALKETIGEMKDYDKLGNGAKARLLNGMGINVDPEKDPAGARNAYEQAKEQKNLARYGVSGAGGQGGGDAGAPQPGESTKHDMTPNGQPIKYDKETGQAYIKGPDGTPVPYSPSADAAGQSALALDSPDAQALAEADPTQQDDSGGAPGEDDGQDKSLLAQDGDDPADDSGEPEDEDTESPEDYERGLYPPGYAPRGPLTQQDDEERGGILS